MDISVVIGSYNQKDRLSRVIEGYKTQQTKASFEIIIVDSFSTDGTGKMIDDQIELPFKLRFIQRSNPSGKAEARNVGVQEASSELIIISDADMIPDPEFIQAHLTAHRNSRQLCCFEGLAYNLTDDAWPPNKDQLAPQVPKKYTANAPLDWYYFLTGNISFPKSIFTVEQGFSLEFKSYGWYDLELGYRLKKRCIPLYYLPSAINYHYHIISDDERSERKYSMGQSAQIFLKKHPELKWFLGLNPLSTLIRRALTPEHPLVRGIRSCKTSRFPMLRRFSYWFMGEFNYLSGVLNLPHKESIKGDATPPGE